MTRRKTNDMPSASTAAPKDLGRQLMIKTKTCQRMVKEVAYYKEEVKENESKLAAMKLQSDKDQYDIKRFENVLGESYMMVPDSTKRLQATLDDLAEFVAQLVRDEAIESSDTVEWLATAQQLLRDNTASNAPLGETGVVETRVDDLAEGEAF